MAKSVERTAREMETTNKIVADQDHNTTPDSSVKDAKDTNSYMFLRIKRKRNEDPLDCLVVQSDFEHAPALKRQHVDKEPLLLAFGNLTVKKEKRFVFKRIDTMEKSHLEADKSSKWTHRLKTKMKQMRNERVSAKQKTGQTQIYTQERAEKQRSRVKKDRFTEMQRARGLNTEEIKGKNHISIREQQTLELPGLWLVDFEHIPSSISDGSLSLGSIPPSGDTITVNGAKLRPMRVLNPAEREVDEAIWMAFRHNDFSHFFRVFQNGNREQQRQNPAQFQRPCDGSTILMAAAIHNRADVIETLLRSNSVDVLQEDWNGATAASFAQRKQHTSIESALRACEEAEREKEYVYDVYCVDMNASQQQKQDEHSTVQSDLSAAPVVAVSAAVQRWLAQEADMQQEFLRGEEADHVDEYLLESDLDSNDEVDGDSEDSNDEGYIHNDYPDEEDEDSDDSLDSDEENMRMTRWKPANPHELDQVDGDY